VDSLGTKVKVRFYGIDCPETEKSNRKTGRISKAGNHMRKRHIGPYVARYSVSMYD
jgi:endonuclease YncB( thermonuclease family)